MSIPLNVSCLITDCLHAVYCVVSVLYVQVRVAALQNLVKIMSLYYQYMETYMGPALFAVRRQHKHTAACVTCDKQRVILDECVHHHMKL